MSITYQTTQSPITIPTANEQTEGLLTAAQCKKINNLVAENDVFIYVNSVTGNDNKDGSTPAKAVKTITRATELVPLAWSKACQVIFAPGTYDVDPTATNYGTVFGPIGGPKGIKASPMTWSGGFTNEYGDKPSLPSNGEFVKNASIGVTANRGDYVSVMTGANAGQRRMVISSGVTTAGAPSPGQFNVNVAFDNPILNGDVFRIEKPSVTINGSIFSFLGIGNFLIGMKGFRFENPWFPGNTIIQAFYSNIVMEGCQFNGLGFSGPQHSALFHAQSFSQLFYNTDLPIIFDDALRGPAGVYIQNSFINATAFSTLKGFFVMDNCFIQADTQSEVELRNPNLKNTSIVLFQKSTCEVEGGFRNGFTTVRSVLDGGNITANDSGVQVVSTTIKNSGGDAIQADSGSFVAVFDVDGTGNAGVGLHSTNSAKMLYDSSTSVTGVGGDIQLQGAAATTYAAVNGATAISDVRLNMVGKF
jgi:hypothetical protein